MQLSKKTIDAIIAFEVTSPEYYEKKYQNPTWPGGDSGVTVGIGYDLGQEQRDTIVMDWTGNVNLNYVSVMAALAGITGEAAKAKLTGLVKNIVIPYSAAYNVFVSNTLPRYCKIALRTYPGLDKLNPDTQGAIVSLIYNRGNKLTGDSRTEMAELVPLIQNADYTGIADAIERMKRVWIGKEGMAGLIERREVEAKIVTDSLTSVDQMTGAHIYNV
jgi:GH24 family phage-related lysozyme (muramidase)